jgi:hypothetical protein
MRDQNTFNSSVFGAPILMKATRTKLGGDSSGTANLFGDDQVTYEKSSDNPMIPKA